MIPYSVIVQSQGELRVCLLLDIELYVVVISLILNVTQV